MTTEKETGLVLNATQFGLEPSKAEMLEATFAPMVAKFKELETDYATVKGKPISKEVCAEAKRVRLAYVKVRTGTDDLHKKAKEDLLIQTRAIDGIRNIVKFACNDHETDLEKLEKHFEILEAERKAKLKAERETELAPFEVDTQFVNLGEMPDEVWQNYFNGAKASFEAKKEAERKAEEERIAREKAEAEERERQRLENIRLKEEAERRGKEIAAERAKAEAERKRIYEQARIEREKQEAILRKEREEREAEQRKEAERIAALQAELKAKQDAEAKAKREAEEKAKAEELARKQAAKAPKKQKLNTWIDGFVMGTPAGLNDDETVKEILEKFSAFKVWAKNKVEAL